MNRHALSGLIARALPEDLHADQCWPWPGYIDKDGYGNLSYRDPDTGRCSSMQAHRAVWTALIGPLPVEFPDLDHLCRNRACVNPNHLEPVTHRVNCQRRPARAAA